MPGPKHRVGELDPLRIPAGTNVGKTALTPTRPGPSQPRQVRTVTLDVAGGSRRSVGLYSACCGVGEHRKKYGPAKSRRTFLGRRSATAELTCRWCKLLDISATVAPAQLGSAGCP